MTVAATTNAAVSTGVVTVVVVTVAATTNAAVSTGVVTVVVIIVTVSAAVLLLF